MDKIIVYCDGGARGNGKSDSVGGWGVLLEYKAYSKEFYGGEKGVTNNQMELKGAINALRAIKTTNIPIEMMIDSAYVVNGINQWVKGWKRNGWTKKGGEIKNLELWKELDRLVSLQDDLQILKIKGHAGHEGNEKADELANRAMNEVE